MKNTSESALGSIGLFAFVGFMETINFILTGVGVVLQRLLLTEEIEKITPTVANTASSIAKKY